ncbi:hypothetical protein VB10N_33030 [Vibrio sp. 10N]|nr:hypothetical protein VB10N_33030 [Vibrio sp. 10N]
MLESTAIITKEREIPTLTSSLSSRFAGAQQSLEKRPKEEARANARASVTRTVSRDSKES